MIRATKWFYINATIRHAFFSAIYFWGQQKIIVTMPLKRNDGPEHIKHTASVGMNIRLRIQSNTFRARKERLRVENDIAELAITLRSLSDGELRIKYLEMYKMAESYRAMCMNLVSSLEKEIREVRKLGGKALLQSVQRVDEAKAALGEK